MEKMLIKQKLTVVVIVHVIVQLNQSSCDSVCKVMDSILGYPSFSRKSHNTVSRIKAVNIVDEWF